MPTRAGIAAALTWSLAVVVASGLPASGAPPEGYLGVLVRERAETLRARTTGRVAEIRSRLGATVRPGDLLVLLDDEDARRSVGIARAALGSAEAQRGRAAAELTLARTRLARREGATELVSREEIEAAREEVLIASAEVERVSATVAQARLELDRALADLDATRIAAPFAGVVAESWRAIGERVVAGDALVRLVGEGALWVRFAVPESEARRLEPGLGVAVRLDGGDRELAAVIRRIAPDIDEPSGMIFVEALVSDGAGGGDAPAAGVVRVLNAARAAADGTPPAP